MKTLKKIISVLLSAAIMLNLCLIPSAAETAAIVITNEAELMKLVEDCRLDSYSKGLSVRLANDITLNGEFEGIPTFGGTFDGGGFTVYAFNPSVSGSVIGFFRYIQKGALVKNLNIKGTVVPSGEKEYVAGICGNNSGSIVNCSFSGTCSGASYVAGIAATNEKSGIISGCSSAGVIKADHYAGGICGENAGTIIGCRNEAGVNISESEIKLSLEDIDLESISGLGSAEETTSQTDTGGIAGFSSGIIQNCTNDGTIGYQHIGYNNGGIVGRQWGYLNGCVNNGTVYGRKDVGGIAGQMEPYKSIDFSEDLLDRLTEEIKVLEACVNRLVSDAKGENASVSNEVQRLTDEMETARNSADVVSDKATEIFNGYSDGINSILTRIDETVDDFAPITEAFTDAISGFSTLSEQLREMLDLMKTAGGYSDDAISEARSGLNTVDNAVSSISDAAESVEAALKLMQKAMGDTEEVKNAASSLISSLGIVSNAFSELGAAIGVVNGAFAELHGWFKGDDWTNLNNGLNELAAAADEFSAAFAKASAAIEVIANAVDSSKIEAGLNDLSDAANELNKAAEHLAAAFSGIASGGDITAITADYTELAAAAENLHAASEKLVSAAKNFQDAVDESDPELQKALTDLTEAIGEMSAAVTKGSAAVQKINAAINSIRNSGVPDDVYNKLSSAAGLTENACDALSYAVSTAENALNRINNQLDMTALKDSLGELSEAAAEISEAADTLSSSSLDFDNAADALESAIGALNSAFSKGEEAAMTMKGISEKLTDVSASFSALTKTLSEKPKISFPAADEDFTASLNAFSADTADMISTLKRISVKLQSGNDTVLNDLQAISDELSVIADLFIDFEKEQSTKSLADTAETYTEDTSAENDGTTEGKAFRCENYGAINGDLNVGGICGSMAIEYDFDPEDEIATEGSNSVNFKYNVKDVISHCFNGGEITSKKNYCGGIVGKMDMGLVVSSVENGNVTATGGNYCGGIAGMSASKINDCVSKVSLSGADYLGGIAGHGADLSNNYAIAEIRDSVEFVGAILGGADIDKLNAENGNTVENNRFVDRGVGGIDGISYKNVAEPISFAEFAKVAGDEAVLVITFMSDDTVIKEVSVPFGEGIPATEIPTIPEKADCFAEWESFDLSCVTFSHIVNAVYTPLVTTIETTNQSGGFSLVMADGRYDGDDKITIETESASVVPQSANAQLRIVTVSGSAADKLRFLKPDSDKDYTVYQNINGAWQELSAENNGKYLVISDPQLENGRGEYCLAERSPNLTLIIIIAAAVALIIANIIVIGLVIRNRKLKKKLAEEEKKKEE